MNKHRMHYVDLNPGERAPGPLELIIYMATLAALILAMLAL